MRAARFGDSVTAPILATAEGDGTVEGAPALVSSPGRRQKIRGYFAAAYGALTQGEGEVIRTPLRGQNLTLRFCHWPLWMRQCSARDSS